MNGKRITSELEKEIKAGKGCILFDFGCYFPYQEQNNLKFSFSLGVQEMPDIQLDHRYPNKGYVTISRKRGKEKSKIGYPYFVDLKTLPANDPMLLCLHFGIPDEQLQLVFPMLVALTPEKPVCGLSFRMNFVKGNFWFSSHHPMPDYGWSTTIWTNQALNRAGEDEILFTEPARLENSLLYQEIVTPHACTLPKLMLC